MHHRLPSDLYTIRLRLSEAKHHDYQLQEINYQVNQQSITTIKEQCKRWATIHFQMLQSSAKLAEALKTRAQQSATSPTSSEQSSQSDVSNVELHSIKDKISTNDRNSLVRIQQSLQAPLYPSLAEKNPFTEIVATAEE